MRNGVYLLGGLFQSTMISNLPIYGLRSYQKTCSSSPSTYIVLATKDECIRRWIINGSDL